MGGRAAAARAQLASCPCHLFRPRHWQTGRRIELPLRWRSSFLSIGLLPGPARMAPTDSTDYYHRRQRPLPLSRAIPSTSAWVLGFIGLAIAFNSLWLLLTLVPFALVIRYGVVAREEAYLERKFGDVLSPLPRAREALAVALPAKTLAQGLRMVSRCSSAARRLSRAAGYSFAVCKNVRAVFSAISIV